MPSSEAADRQFPGFAEIFMLGRRITRRDYECEVEKQADLDLFYQVMRNFADPGAEPVRLRQTTGGKVPDDIFWASIPMGPILGPAITDAWESAGVTGWSRWPVVITSKAGQVFEGWSLILTDSQVSVLDFTRGRREWLPPGEEIRRNWDPEKRKIYSWIGCEFNPRSWSGDDVFRGGEPPAYIGINIPRVSANSSLLLTKTAADVIRNSQQFQEKKNLQLEPLTEIVRSESSAFSILGIHSSEWEDFSIALGNRTGYIAERRGPWW